MDLAALRTFVKVAELASFTRAAEQLGLAKARASLQVQALEAELGVRLLHRTTRTVRTTPDGDQLLGHARRLVVEADELAAMFQPARALRGVVRLDLPIAISRDVILPRVPDLLAAHPQLELQISTTDRRVDVIREGFDCVLRVGALADSGLAARRLGALAMANCVSPGYARRHGVPRTLAELDRHLVVHYSLALGADRPSFDYVDGARTVERPMRAAVTVNSSDAYRAACSAGLGIIQVPRVGVRAAFADGSLIEVLPDHPCPAMPVSIVHGHGRNVPRRVRAVMTWLTQVVQAYLA
jgi:DNA-binding transcriptional LysR family regulator